MTRKIFRRGRDGISPISEQNSTTTALSSGATFTGVSDDVNDYRSVSVAIYTDTPSAFCGLLLECSIDNVVWVSLAEETVPSGEIIIFEHNLHVRYFRVRYTTDGAQGTFALSTTYYERPAAIEPTTELALAPLNTEIQNETNQAIHELVQEQKLTNLYLSEIVGEVFHHYDLDEID